jgi:hypothetical protein
LTLTLRNTLSLVSRGENDDENELVCKRI